ncbi:gamma-glutamylcyclotransferase family protein [Paenibacillus sp.]|uniref:gamma-glutamylcyclotransferase family protein n=1 Tax=Paenibacillus sp. TaxID=58172 RepID=UPI002D48488C|nr:gamma-glutamylcyclotransferase family protein [Paenibacillus sp.]HZG85696.1 gamma-glutamylcyclotransferase family protein [Paenibacillus sp.]
MDQKQRYVFVYGTLLRGEANHARLKHAELAGEQASLLGASLVDTGRGYPAMLLGGAGAVAGEVYEIDERTLRSLDELEDYYGEGDRRNEYERIEVEVDVEAGERRIRAWTYVYRSAPANAVPIPAGDWRAYRRSLAG